MRIFKHTLIYSLSLVSGVLINAESICNSTTSKYPILIDATTESLETGLESGLFTSVDLVNAYIARILEVNATLHVGKLSFPSPHVPIERICDMSRQHLLRKHTLHFLVFLQKNKC